MANGKRSAIARFALSGECPSCPWPLFGVVTFPVPVSPRVLGSCGWDCEKAQGTAWGGTGPSRNCNQDDLYMLIKQRMFQKNVTSTKI